MKTLFTILPFLLLSIYAESIGQTDMNKAGVPGNTDGINKHLPLFLGTVNETNKSKNSVLPDLRTYLDKLCQKRTRIKSDNKFFNYLFYKTHRKYLKHYQPHTSVEDILERGAYDCVSGTAFYALLLNYLGMDYEIKEFDFHVLIIAKSGDRQFLIESTDPTGGLNDNPKEIADRIRYYVDKDNSNNNLSVGSHEQLYQYAVAINHKNISLTELAGLLHYNNAVYYYNQKKVFKAAASIQKSFALYDSKRIRAFRQLAARSFLGDPNLTQLQKEKLIDLIGLELVALK